MESFRMTGVPNNAIAVQTCSLVYGMMAATISDMRHYVSIALHEGRSIRKWEGMSSEAAVPRPHTSMYIEQTPAACRRPTIRQRCACSGSMADMEARLRGLREAAMQKSKTGAGSKRARSTPRSRSVSRSPSRSVSPAALRARSPSRSPSRSFSRTRSRSRSPLRVRRRGADDAPARLPRDERDVRGYDRVDRRDGGAAGRSRRHGEFVDAERGRERERRDRRGDWDRERERERVMERERELRGRDRELREREREREWERSDREYRDRRYRDRSFGGRGRGGYDRHHDDGHGQGRRGREEQDSRTVFVSQLAQRVNEDDVYDLFSAAGRVRNVRLIADRRSRCHKGHGYVEFHDVADVPGAIALNGKLIRGYPVSVKAGNQSATPVPVPQPPPPPAPGVLGGTPHANSLPSSSVSPPAPVLLGETTLVPSQAPPPAPPRLVSVQELAKLLNPNNLPLAPVPSSLGVGGDVGPDGKLITQSATLVENVNLPESEQVPLPIPGTTPTVLPSALGAAPQQQSAISFTRLYVGSVPFTVSEDDLLTIFSPFGAIVSLQLQREASTGRSRGYGFVEFVEHASAKKALGLNGLVLANRALKVNLASSTSAPLVQPLAAAQAAAATLSAGLGTVPLPIPGGEAATVQNADGELDEGRDGGLAMNSAQRAQLMQRLSRGEDMGSLPAAANESQYNSPCATTDKQTCCLLLSNMFDPVAEAASNSDFDVEVAEDVREEVSEKYGAVKHLFVDKSSRGLVYLIFHDVGSALKAKSALNGRWFGGLCISAAFVEDEVYKKRLPDAPL